MATFQPSKHSSYGLTPEEWQSRLVAVQMSPEMAAERLQSKSIAEMLIARGKIVPAVSTTSLTRWLMYGSLAGVGVTALIFGGPWLLKKVRG